MDTKPSKSRLQHQHQQEQTSEQQVTSQTQTHREFASVEDLLRYDASQTTPPPAIAERLKTSLGKEPQPGSRQSWWRRLFVRRSAGP
jgi:transcription initiation factor TFIID subunit TAF12